MSEPSNLGAMTVNERLSHFGLVSAFDTAIKARDKSAAISILMQAGLSAEQAEYTASQTLKAPARYGY